MSEDHFGRVFRDHVGQTPAQYVIDRRVAAEQPVLEALKVLLALPRSRLEATELLSLLEVAAVRRRFGLDRRALDLDPHQQFQGLPWQA